MRELKEGHLPRRLVFAQSLSSIAPLSSTAALLTVVLSQSLASSPVAALLGFLMYGVWVAIGYSYSSTVASYGGTYEFARRSAGERVASSIGWMYWLSYTAYISAITSYLAGVIVPTVTGAPSLYARLLCVAVPLVIAGIVATGVEVPLNIALVTSSAEVLVIVLTGVLVLGRLGLRPLEVTVAPRDLLGGAAVAAFTVAGGGASFFMGYEARNGSKDVSKSFLAAFLVGAASIGFASYYEVVAAGYSNQAVARLLSVTQYPGLYIAGLYGGPLLETVYLALTLSSLISSSIAAYVAVQRLMHALTGSTLNRVTVAELAVILIINAIIALAGPAQAYVYAVTASLAALFISHAAISGLYVRFSRIYKGNHMALRAALAAGGVVIMAVGLYYEVLSLGVAFAVAGLVPAALASLWGPRLFRPTALYRRTRHAQVPQSS